LSRKCGSLDFSQPYGPSQPVTGIALPFYIKVFNIKMAELGDVYIKSISFTFLDTVCQVCFQRQRVSIIQSRNRPPYLHEYWRVTYQQFSWNFIKRSIDRILGYLMTLFGLHTLRCEDDYELWIGEDLGRCNHVLLLGKIIADSFSKEICIQQIF
jgi:hypothetical protein